MKTGPQPWIILLMVLWGWLSGTAVAQEIVTIPDPNLETAIRSALAKPTGALMRTDLAGLFTLTANSRTIVSLSGLEGATNLTNLNLSDNSIRSLAPVAGLSRLTQLNVDHNCIDDLSPLAGLTTLDTLYAGRNQIANPNPLTGLTNLARLRLSGNAIGDMNFVIGLTRLSSLELDNNLISSLPTLTALTNLGSLALGGNPLGDLAPLGGLLTVTSLSLPNLGITNANIVQGLSQLRSLNLEGNHLRNISTLAGLINLTELNLRWNQVTNYGGVLSGFTNLTTLNFGGNAIVNVGFLQNLPRLTHLNLSENGIRNIAPIGGLTNLTYLVLSVNAISNYSALAALSGMMNLELRGNAISNLTFLSNCSRLNYADLAYNRITDLTPLLGLTNLGSLVLTGNPIDSQSGLSAMTQLTNLWSSGIQISNLTVLQGLGQMHTLILDENQISDPSPLAALTNLTRLSLSQNPVTNYAAVARLTNLTSLWLNGNAISNLGFVQSLPWLRTLELRNNRVIDFAALVGLTNLADCFADYNYLTNISDLASLPHLARVRIVGNPLEVRSGPTATNLQDLQQRGVELVYLPTNLPPTFAILTNWFIAADEKTSLDFNLSDDVTPTDQLLVTISSSNPALIPESNISISGTNTSRTLTVIPATNQTGTAQLTLTALDEAGTSSRVTIQISVLVPQPVSIADLNLEIAIRSAVNKSGGGLTTVDLLGLTDLIAVNSNIVSLSGLEVATNLSRLYLSGNSLTNLNVLQVFGRLNSLILNQTATTNLAPLTRLTNLASLYMSGGIINDLSFLQNLTRLTSLNLDDNQVTDLGSLVGLTNLTSITLRENRLTNIAPLLTLPQLADVDVSLNLLDISLNSSALTVIQVLQERGCLVKFDPQRGPPTISVRPTWIIKSNAISSLSFGVAEDVLFGHPFVVQARSSNTNLLPNQNILVGPTTNADWFLAVSPANNQIGSTTITLTATNNVGLGTSVTILVTVVVPLPLSDQSLGSGNLAWVTGGDIPWFAETSISHDGVAAAQSGSIQNSQESWMETTLGGPGILTFWWKVSSEANFDWLEFRLDGVLDSGRISGEVDWQQKSVNIPIGSQTVRWRYFKEAADSIGLDTAWVDEVTYVPLSWLELVGFPTNGKCQLLLHPVLGKQYQLQASTNLTTWIPLAVVPATNSAQPFLDSSAATATRYYRLLELSPGLIWLQNPSPSGNDFKLDLHSPPGLRFEIQASTNLLNWTGVGVVSNALGTVQHHDLISAGLPKRFYRALLLP